ncbi:MAG: RDD family protein [Desulfobacteraceae bacterium]|jgi:uncharacterized RDD family membrane protein YckC
MEQSEYRFTANVLDKWKEKVDSSDQERAPELGPTKSSREVSLEGANCLLTENELVIQGDQPIRIPLAWIKDKQLAVPDISVGQQPTMGGPEHSGGSESMGTLTITYFDDHTWKHRLSLKMDIKDAAAINATLKDTIPKAQKRNWDWLPIEIKSAGFSIRLGAHLIDSLILGASNGALMLVFDPQLGKLLTVILIIVYFIGFWTWKGQTPGKMACGIQITKKDGRPINLGRSVLRYIGYYVSGIPLFLGYLWIIWDRKRQGFHDKLAGTYVVLRK